MEVNIPVISCNPVSSWLVHQNVLVSSLGPAWSSHLTSFNRLPFAAASIGQVHTAILSPSSSPTGRSAKVAVKIQFPNIADSIESDLGYVKLLLTAGSLLPKGLFLDRTIQVGILFHPIVSNNNDVL
jgi:aarF domain-containing kinase